MKKFDELSIKTLIGISNYSFIIGAILVLAGLFSLPLGLIYIAIAAALFYIGSYTNKLCNKKQQDEFELRRSLNRTEWENRSHMVIPPNTPTSDLSNKILKRRPEDTDSNRYKVWENEYAESKLDKNIRYPHKCEDILYQFDFQKMAYRYSCGNKNNNGSDVYYIISAEHKEKAAQYLLNVNLLLDNLHKKYNKIPLLAYKISSLSFEQDITYPGIVCKVFHHPLTATGKLAKYPYSLMLAFGVGDNSNFTLFFDKLGNVLKGDLVCWYNKTCYILKASVYNKEFQVTQVYRNDLGKKVKLYDAKE